MNNNIHYKTFVNDDNDIVHYDEFNGADQYTNAFSKYLNLVATNIEPVRDGLCQEQFNFIVLSIALQELTQNQFPIPTLGCKAEDYIKAQEVLIEAKDLRKKGELST